jgi:hypothetical protein
MSAGQTFKRKVVVPVHSGSETAVEIEVRERWLVVTTFRFDSALDARNYCDALEKQLHHSGHRDVLVDARRHKSGTREASDIIWDWVDSCAQLERMALINESENIATAIRMRNLTSPKKKVRPFRTVIEAQRWLLTGE